MKKSFCLLIGLLCINLIGAQKVEMNKEAQSSGIVGHKYEIGSNVFYHWYVSSNIDKDHCALYVLLEHKQDIIVPLFEQFIAEGIMPGGLMLFLRPGMLNATLPGGSNRYMRAEEYDQLGPDFTNFIIHDLVPHASAQGEITISPNPDMHFIAGGSSGGLAAWNALWFRNDYFRRGFLSSPTFSAIRGGEEAMTIVRKCETRPMRFYLTVGTTEPDYYFGDSYYAARNAEGAFLFANYDFRFEMFPGEGHCARREDPELLRRVMTFVWHNWKTQPLTVRKNQIRIENLLTPGSQWEEVKNMPSKQQVTASNGFTYIVKDSKIFAVKDGKEMVVAEDLDSVSAVGISCDRWRLYVAAPNRRFIFAYGVKSDGTLAAQYKLSPLHLAHDCRRIGATDIAVSDMDRVFAATELGVQGIISFGVTDLILPLPGDLPCDKVVLEGNMLYVSSGNKVFRRPIKDTAQDLNVTKPPTCPGYGDNFDYSRKH